MMDTIDAIFSRTSVGKVEPDPIPRETIEKLLSAAVQAPNHYKVRPWRFVVLTGESLERLGDVMADSFAARFPDTPESAHEKEKEKALRAPLMIAVGVDPPDKEKVDEIENICAAAAAVENLLLAAHALGLGAKWRTGKHAADPKIKEFLGFTPEQHLIALLYIGYPSFQAETPERPSFDDRTVWMA